MQTIIELNIFYWVLLVGVFYIITSAVISLIGRLFYKQLLISADIRKEPTVKTSENIKLNILNFIVIGSYMYLCLLCYRLGYGNLYLETPTTIGSIVRTILEVFAILLIMDTIFYWFHRWVHENPKWYKKLHLDHHLARYPTVWTSLYMSPWEYLLSTTLPGMIVVLFPFNVWSFLIAAAVKHFTDITGHSGFEITGKTITYITGNGVSHSIDPERKNVARLFTTVTHHDLHHQNVRGNYGIYFTHWDRICGTDMKNTDSIYKDTKKIKEA